MNASKVRHWDYIDALRGLAALGVLIVHTQMFFPQLPWRASQLAGLGTHGVQLFFMVSAITLASSWHARSSAEPNPAQAFFIRRFFRIAPMFWAAMVAYIAISMVITPFWKSGILNARSIYLSTIFGHGWSPQTINAVVPGGWSIADEMTFYLMFPVLMMLVTNLRRALLFFAVTVVIALCANQLATYLYDPKAPYFDQFTYYWLPNQMPVFAMGFIAYFLIPRVTAAMANKLLAAGVVPLLGLALANPPYFATVSHPMIWRDLIAGAGFMAIILALSARPWAALVNRLTRKLGEVSFSSYLLQFGVLESALLIVGKTSVSGATAIGLFVLAVMILLAINTTLASITYRAIEKPFIRVGHAIASRRVSVDPRPIKLVQQP